MEQLATIQANVLAALHPFTASKDVRYYLAGVYLEPAGDNTPGAVAVATNGHQLLMVTDYAAECPEPIIVQFESTLATQMKKRDAGTATISRMDPDNSMLIISLSNGFAGPAQLIDGKYPAYKNVVPETLSSEPCTRQHYSPEYIVNFCAAEKILRPGATTRGISLVNGGEKEPICVLFPAVSDTVHARGVLMPLVQKGDYYAWTPPGPVEE
jgi:hypothetical protein